MAVNKELADRISAVFDEVMSAYEADHHIIFETDSIRRKLHFGGRDARLAAWKRTRRCIYTDCRNQSLRRSHTVSKSALTLISEHGEVLAPEFDHHVGRVEMKARGLAWASTFPGFCSEHEKLFFDFEQRRGIAAEQHVVLQLYRSICREITRKRIEVQTMERDLAAYEKQRDAGLIKLLHEKLGANLVKQEELEFKKLEFTEGDPVTKRGHKFLAGAREDLKTLELEHLGLLEHAMRDPARSEISPIVVTIDAPIPLALSGLAVFHVQDQETPHKVLTILNVIPMSTETLLLIYGPPRHQRYVEGYLANWRDTSSILNMIESWMIHGTDHWFVRPSVWQSIPSTRQRAILDAILDDSKNIGDYPEYSVFDDIRRSQIASAEQALSIDPNDSLASKVLAREQKKLDLSLQ